jgi:hypothetical protein
MAISGSYQQLPLLMSILDHIMCMAGNKIGFGLGRTPISPGACLARWKLDGFVYLNAVEGLDP